MFTVAIYPQSVCALCTEQLKYSNCRVKPSNAAVRDEDIFNFVTWFGFTLWQLPILLKPSLLKYLASLLNFPYFLLYFEVSAIKANCFITLLVIICTQKELISVTFIIRYSKIK